VFVDWVAGYTLISLVWAEGVWQTYGRADGCHDSRIGVKPGKKVCGLATKSLYVGNLPYSVTEDELRTMFEPYGPIEEVRVIQNKGFAFVDVPQENVEAAIEATNGKDMGGRTVTVNEAKPREDRPRGGGGGDRGGYGGGGGGGRRSGW
jgi:cold-inducible RNA-binding protein